MAEGSPAISPRARAGTTKDRASRSSRRRRRFVRPRDFLPNRASAVFHRQGDDSDHGMSNTDSHEQSSPSSDEENVKPKRKRILEDALFEFFSKEAVKSVKRDFSKFCMEADIWTERKRLKTHGVGRDAFSTYSIKYYWEILNCMTDHQKGVIAKFGYCLLMFGKSEIPSSFIRWIAGCVDTASSQIIIDEHKTIPISKNSVHYVLGLPNTGSVAMPDCEGGLNFVMSLFNLTEVPHITFFGNKLKSTDDLSEKVIFVCFMTIVMKCFLLPTSDQYANTDFISLLEDPEKTKDFDLCLLVYEHIISGINKFIRAKKVKGRKPKEFEFCFYYLAVHYLDCLDFGARVIEQAVPRIAVWKGNMIKFFADLDVKRKNIYGKRQLKKQLANVYKEVRFFPMKSRQDDHITGRKKRNKAKFEVIKGGNILV